MVRVGVARGGGGDVAELAEVVFFVATCSRAVALPLLS